MKTILVPLDGSALAEQVLPYVRMLAPILHSRLHLVRVVTDTDVDTDRAGAMVHEIADVYSAGGLSTREEHADRMRQMLRERAESYLISQAAQFTAAGMEAEVDVRIGPAAEVIVEAAEGDHVGMIVMATHGYSGLRRWALGSIADKIIHATATPVMVIRESTTTAVVAPVPKRILVPLDGSGLARQTLPLAAELAASAKAELILLRAVPPTLDVYPDVPSIGRLAGNYAELMDVMREEAHADLESVAADLRHRDLQVTITTPIGYAAEVIVDEAEQHQIDLIVMATHGYSGLRRWALGSVADKVLHATRTPLVLVRASA